MNFQLNACEWRWGKQKSNLWVSSQIFWLQTSLLLPVWAPSPLFLTPPLPHYLFLPKSFFTLIFSLDFVNTNVYTVHLHISWPFLKTLQFFLFLKFLVCVSTAATIFWSWLKLCYITYVVLYKRTGLFYVLNFHAQVYFKMRFISLHLHLWC